MSWAHRRLDRVMYRRPGSRKRGERPWEYRDDPWVVRAERRGTVVALVCVHLYRHSAVVIRRYAAECWETLAMESRYEAAKRLVCQARGRPPADEAEVVIQDAVFEAEYPVLHAFLFTQCGPDEGAGCVGSLSLFVADGAVKVVLNDRPAKRSLWASGSSVVGAFEALEGRLASDVVEWRSNKAIQRRK